MIWTSRSFHLVEVGLREQSLYFWEGQAEEATSPFRGFLKPQTWILPGESHNFMVTTSQIPFIVGILSGGTLPPPLLST